jgi:hypothetical protein
MYYNRYFPPITNRQTFTPERSPSPSLVNDSITPRKVFDIAEVLVDDSGGNKIDSGGNEIDSGVNEIDSGVNEVDSGVPDNMSKSHTIYFADAILSFPAVGSHNHNGAAYHLDSGPTRAKNRRPGR